MKASAWLIRILLLLSGGGLIGYALALLPHIRFNTGQTLCLLLGAPLLLWGLFYTPLSAWSAGGFGRFVLWTLRIGYAAAALVIAVFCGILYSAAAQPPQPNADAVVVLGAGLRGENVSLTLQRRLDAAHGYLLENPDTLCVVSGGQGADEVISEAEAMRRYLVRLGIQPERILMEEQSANTAQNLAFSYALLAEQGLADGSIAVASSDFHIFRGIRLARGVGFAQVSGIAAPSEPYLLPQYCLREMVGIVKDWLMGRFG